MWKHISEAHGGEKGEEIFSMKMEAGFKKPLARQIKEGVEIEMSKGVLMNSKSEWNNSKIPRIVIETGEDQREDQESGLGNKEEKEKRDRRRENRELHTVRNPEKRKLGDTNKDTGGDENDTGQRESDREQFK